MIKTCFDEFVKCFAHRLDDMMNKRLASIAFQRKERGGAGNCFYDCAGAEVGVSGSVLREKTAEYLKCNSDENEKISLSLCVCFFLSFSDIFFLSFSHTTIFLHLSQIFKANINLCGMKINGVTLKTVFLISVSFSWFPSSLFLTHKIIQTFRCLHAVAVCADQNYHHNRVIQKVMFEQVQEPFLRYPSHSESYIRTSTRNPLAVAVVCRSNYHRNRVVQI